MGIFKSREQRELEQKQLIKRTVYNMNKQIEALEEQKKSFAEKATRAKANGLDAQYELAITGYRLTLLQQKRAQEMLLNFEITSQLKDMALMTKQFLGGRGALSTQMSRRADGSDFERISRQFKEAMNKAQGQAEQMENFMQDSRTAFNGAAEGAVTDEAELERITEERAASGEFSDDAVDREIEQLRKKIEAQI